MPREIDNGQVNYHRTLYRAYDETSQQYGYWIRRDSSLADEIISSQPTQMSNGNQNKRGKRDKSDTYVYHAKDFSIARTVGQLGSHGRSMFITIRGNRPVPPVICKYEIDYERDLYLTTEPVTQNLGFWINKDSNLAKNIIHEYKPRMNGV